MADADRLREGVATELIRRGDLRFGKRQSLDQLRQEIALMFAPQLAEWTGEQTWGADYASHLVDGAPVLIAREFVGQIGAMLRPEGKQWFWHRHHDDAVNTNVGARAYLDWRSGQMMRIMTDRVTGFQRATKQADEMFGLFGDAVLSIDTDETGSSLRIAAYHTKDCVWAIGSDNRPDTITRKEQPAARVVKQRFGQPIDVLHPKLAEKCERDGEQTIDLRHEMVPADEYDSYIAKRGKRGRAEGWYSVWVDATHRNIIRETWRRSFRYVIPRWVTLTGRPYAISPATMTGLPDARLLQQQAVAILEAAERQINPPLIATNDAIRGDVRLDGITWVDKGYDERMGDPLRALELGKNFRLGVETLARTEAQLMRSFYLDRLRMPDTRNSKSTVEVSFLIDEFIRGALPLFAPMQADYNDPMLAEVDLQIQEMGGYDGREVPGILREAISGPGMTFAWNNPLSEMIDRQLAQRLAEVGTIGQTIAGIEAAAGQVRPLRHIDTGKALRETVIGLGGASWLVDEATANARADEDAKAAAQQQQLAAAPVLADVVHRGAQAAQIASEIPSMSEPNYALPMPA